MEGTKTCSMCGQEFSEGGVVVIYSLLGIGRSVVVMPADDFTDLRPHTLRMQGRDGKTKQLCGKACWLRFTYDVFDEVAETVPEPVGDRQ